MSPDHLEFVRENAPNFSQAKMATALGCHQKAVARALKRLGLPSKPKTGEHMSKEEHKFIRARSADLSQTQIASELGRSLVTIKRAQKRLGVLPSKYSGVVVPHWVPDELRAEYIERHACRGEFEAARWARIAKAKLEAGK